MTPTVQGTKMKKQRTSYIPPPNELIIHNRDEEINQPKGELIDITMGISCILRTRYNSDSEREYYIYKLN